MATLLPGTLDMLILRTLAIERMHGYAIAQHIARVSKNALLIEKGSLYPALERLQRSGWVTSKWAAARPETGWLPRVTETSTRTVSTDPRNDGPCATAGAAPSHAAAITSARPIASGARARAATQTKPTIATLFWGAGRMTAVASVSPCASARLTHRVSVAAYHGRCVRKSIPLPASTKKVSHTSRRADSGMPIVTVVRSPVIPRRLPT